MNALFDAHPVLASAIAIGIGFAIVIVVALKTNYKARKFDIKSDK